VAEPPVSESVNHSIRDLLRACERSAVHLEMRDGYMRSDPMFIAWQTGGRDAPVVRDTFRSWTQLVREITGRGVDVRRARIVSEPISEYVRFEYEISDTNVAAGENIRWVPRRRATDLALPGNDFWLLDERLVIVIHFTGEGESGGRETTTDPAVVKLCASAFEAVWERAIPHEDYRPT
jgi:hypothetical protein